jgi:hypothetical protein
MKKFVRGIFRTVLSILNFIDHRPFLAALILPSLLVGALFLFPAILSISAPNISPLLVFIYLVLFGVPFLFGFQLFVRCIGKLLHFDTPRQDGQFNAIRSIAERFSNGR